MSLHLRAYDHGRAETFREISSRVWRLCRALGAVEPALLGWHGSVGGDATALDSERACEGLVASAARMWRSGEKELVAYGPVLTAVHDGRTVARLTMVAGIAPLGLPVWIPNQLELELRGALKASLRADRPRLESALRAIITVCNPAWAVVAVDGSPSAAVPPFADGTPSVGWLTYLASSYAALPRALPSPAVVHDLGTGTAYVAHPSEPSAGAIAAVSRALAEAKILIPAAEVSRPAG